MTSPIAERLYPACYSATAYSAIASTSELSSERVKGIYISPLLGINVYSLSRARARACSTPGVSSYNFLQMSTSLYKYLQTYTNGLTPPEGGENIKEVLMELTKGTRIYYGGDMANMESTGTISRAYTDKWGSWVDIDLDDKRKFPGVSVMQFSEEYLGNGGTRFVTLEAYNDFRRKQFEACKYFHGLEYKEVVSV